MSQLSKLPQSRKQKPIIYLDDITKQQLRIVRGEIAAAQETYIASDTQTVAMLIDYFRQHHFNAPRQEPQPQ